MVQSFYIATQQITTTYWLKTIQLYYLSFHGSGVQAQLIRVYGSGFHKTTVKISQAVFLSGACGPLKVVVGRIQFLVAIEIRLSAPRVHLQFSTLWCSPRAVNIAACFSKLTRRDSHFGQLRQSYITSSNHQSDILCYILLFRNQTH